MTNRTITDQQVAALPIHGGRAELLEEIMSTPVDQVDRAEHRLDDLAPRRGRRALATVAAVAAVAATVGGLAAWRIPHQTATPDGTSFGHGAEVGTATHGSTTPAPRAQEAQVRSVPGGAYFAFASAGWYAHPRRRGSGRDERHLRRRRAGSWTLRPVPGATATRRTSRTVRPYRRRNTTSPCSGRHGTLWASAA